MTKTKLPRTLNELIKQGEEDGFLVQDDILLVYPDPEKHIEEIDDFFSQALEKGIDILTMVDKHPLSATNSSPKSLVIPYQLIGLGLSSSV